MAEMSMVEKVAKAMAAAESGPEGSALFSIHWDEFGDGYLDSARVAIEAMREPTDAMLDDGRDRANDYLDCGCYASQETAGECWKAMIDAALNSKEG